MYRLSTNLGQKMWADSEEWAKSKGLTLSDFVRDALATMLYLTEQLDSGAVILLRSPDGTVREVVFKWQTKPCPK
jgi:hypothetical protein